MASYLNLFLNRAFYVEKKANVEKQQMWKKSYALTNTIGHTLIWLIF
jgi:hypothetical protein